MSRILRQVFVLTAFLNLTGCGTDELQDDRFPKAEAIVVKDREVPPRRPPSKPDLTVLAVSAPVPSGSNFKVNVTIKNIGSSPAQNFTLLLWDNYTSASTSKTVTVLNAGQSAAFSLIIDSPDEPTTCYLSAIVDYGNKVAESNELNNVKKFVGNW